MKDYNTSFDYLKGIATFIIIFVHIKGITNPIIKEISNFGYIAVSIFFSISGSLLIKKFMMEKNYEKNFVRKKINRIYMPYIIANIIYIVILILFKDYKIEFIKLIKDILGINVINGYTWYINNLLLMYIIFYCLFIFEKTYSFINNTSFKYLVLIVMSYILFTILKMTKLLPFITFNDLSISLFMGMILGFIKTLNNNLFRGKCIKYFLLLVVIILHLFRNSDLMTYLMFSQLLIPIVISVLTQYEFNINVLKRFFTFISKYSLEIYLLHMSVLMLYRNNIIYINNQFIYTILYLLTLIPLVYMLNLINIDKLKNVFIRINYKRFIINLK